MGDLASVVKAYDIRGVVPDQLDEGVAEAVGAAFVRLTGAAIVTVHDMHASSGPLADAFGRGAAPQGADVLASGLGSTDMLYYASGDLGVPGAMVTASHNPPQDNGIRLCLPGPLSRLLAGYSGYFASGEINSQVRDPAEATARVREAFAARPGISTDELDGLTVSADNWWFNVRPSDTEPLLRLNAEADTDAAMAALRDEVLGVVADAVKSTAGE